jgi:hypothetical protein
MNIRLGVLTCIAVAKGEVGPFDLTGRFDAPDSGW